MLIHSNRILAAAREHLKPLGLRQKGRSRTWLDDRPQAWEFYALARRIDDRDAVAYHGFALEAVIDGDVTRAYARIRRALDPNP